MSVARAATPKQSKSDAADLSDRPVHAIVCLLLGMLFFVAMDGAAKYLTATMAPEQIIWARFGVVSVFLLPVLWRYRRQRPWVTAMPIAHCLRGLMLVSSSLLFVIALVHLPLEMATAIGFVSPMYVTALSIPLLGERVGARRWLAVGVGFIGVLIILRPGGTAFQMAMLLPLLSSLCWAFSLIITRRMRGSERPLTILAYSTMIGFVALAALALPVWRAPEAWEWGLLLVIGACHVIGQYMVIRAFTLGSASMLAPFSYSTIVWAILIGALVFGTFPNLPTVIGATVLLTSGLYVWHRERVKTSVTTVPGASIAEVADDADVTADSDGRG